MTLPRPDGRRLRLVDLLALRTDVDRLVTERATARASYLAGRRYQSTIEDHRAGRHVSHHPACSVCRMVRDARLPGEPGYAEDTHDMISSLANVYRAAQRSDPWPGEWPVKYGMPYPGTAEDVERHNADADMVREAMAPAVAAIQAQIRSVADRLGWTYDAPGHGDTEPQGWDTGPMADEHVCDMTCHDRDCPNGPPTPRACACGDTRPGVRPCKAIGCSFQGMTDMADVADIAGVTPSPAQSDPHDVAWRRRAALHGHPGVACRYEANMSRYPIVSTCALDKAAGETQGRADESSDLEGHATLPEDVPDSVADDRRGHGIRQTVETVPGPSWLACVAAMEPGPVAHPGHAWWSDAASRTYVCRGYRA